MSSESANSTAAGATLGLPRVQIRRALRIWMAEGSVATVQIALTSGAFQTGFALYLGCSDFIIGVLAGIPAFAGMLQLFSSYFAQRYGRRKTIVAWFSLISRLLWVPLLLIPFVLPKSLWVGTFLALSLLSSALINVSNPLWMAWITDLVPEDQRGRYFGQRNMYAGLVGMVVSVTGGWFLDAATKQHMMSQPAAFAVIFLTATLFAFGSFGLALSSPDVPGEGKAAQDSGKAASALSYYAAPFADGNFRRFISFSTSLVVAQAIAGQFFTVYQLKALSLNYTAFQLLAAVVSLASLAAMPVWGYLADKYGQKPILVLSVMLVLLPPFQWLLTYPDGIPGLWAYQHNALQISYTKLNITLLNLIAGVGWAGVGLTQFNLMIGAAPSDKRTAYVSAVAAVNGIAGGIAPLLGGALLDALAPLHFPSSGPIRSNYHVLFVLSGLLRLVSLWLLRPVFEAGSRETRYVLGQLKATKPIGTATSLQKLSRAGSPQVRQQAAEELGRLKPPVAVEELVKALDDVALPVREQAAVALGEIGDARATGSLIKKLSDPASGIEKVAATALGRIGDRNALPALAAAAQLGPVSRQLAALEALSRLPDPRVVDVLSSMAASDGLSVRTAAVRGLAEREDPGSAPLLTGLLARERDPALVAVIANALGRLGLPSSAPALVAALDKSASPTVRRELLNAVGSVIGGRDAFYPYLALDSYARDETVGKILLNMQRRLRTRAARGGPPDAARQAVRARQALEAYARGDMTACLGRLVQMSQLLRDGKDIRRRAAGEALTLLNARLTDTSEAAAPEEALLALFLVQQMTDA